MKNKGDAKKHVGSTRKKPSAKNAKMLPPMPENRPVIQLGTIGAKLSMDFKRFSSGHLGMMIDKADILMNDVEVGYIGFYLGGGISIHDNRTERTYSFGVKDVWLAFEEGLKQGEVLQSE